MNIDQEFPKRYITSGDVDGAGQPVRLRITDVVVESIGSGNRAQRKPALVFAGTRKVLALNASNLNAIKSHLGPETAAWINAVVTLQCVDDTFEGRRVRSVRVVAVVPAPLPHADVDLGGAPNAPVVGQSRVFGDAARSEVARRYPPQPLGVPEDDGLRNGF